MRATGTLPPDGVVAVRRLILVVAVAALVLLGVVAASVLLGRDDDAERAERKGVGSNGQIAFADLDSSGSTAIYTVNPDGSGLQKLFGRKSEWPHWSPDGSQVSVFCCDNGMTAHIVDPDKHSFREIAPPDDTLETHCGFWSANGERLACESFGATDESRNGMYSIRSSNGGGLTRITTNPVVTIFRAITHPTANGSCSSGPTRTGRCGSL